KSPASHSPETKRAAQLPVPPARSVFDDVVEIVVPRHVFGFGARRLGFAPGGLQTGGLGLRVDWRTPFAGLPPIRVQPRGSRFGHLCAVDPIDHLELRDKNWTEAQLHSANFWLDDRPRSGAARTALKDG